MPPSSPAIPPTALPGNSANPTRPRRLVDRSDAVERRGSRPCSTRPVSCGGTQRQFSRVRNGVRRILARVLAFETPRAPPTYVEWLRDDGDEVIGKAAPSADLRSRTTGSSWCTNPTRAATTRRGCSSRCGTRAPPSSRSRSRARARARRTSRAPVAARRGGLSVPALDGVRDGRDRAGPSRGRRGRPRRAARRGRRGRADLPRSARTARSRRSASTGGFIYGVTVGGAGDVFACDFGNAAVMRVWRPARSRPTRAARPSARCASRTSRRSTTAGTCTSRTRASGATTTGSSTGSRPGGATEVWTEATSRVPERVLPHRRGGRAAGGRVARSAPWSASPSGTTAAPDRRSRVVDLSGSQPDGIALAEDGTMFVGCYRPDRVYRIAPGGPAEVFAEDADGVVLNQPANVAFWGPNLDRLVVSSLGGWSLVAAAGRRSRVSRSATRRSERRAPRHINARLLPSGSVKNAMWSSPVLGSVDQVGLVAERRRRVPRARGAPPRCRRR